VPDQAIRHWLILLIDDPDFAVATGKPSLANRTLPLDAPVAAVADGAVAVRPIECFDHGIFAERSEGHRQRILGESIDGRERFALSPKGARPRAKASMMSTEMGSAPFMITFTCDKSQFMSQSFFRSWRRLRTKL